MRKSPSLLGSIRSTTTSTSADGLHPRFPSYSLRRTTLRTETRRLMRCSVLSALACRWRNRERRLVANYFYRWISAVVGVCEARRGREWRKSDYPFEPTFSFLSRGTYAAGLLHVRGCAGEAG